MWVDGIAKGDPHLLYERGHSNLTQRLVLMPMATFLVTRESLTGRSSRSSPICSIICLLGRQLWVRWWAPSPCATQLFLQLINFTLHVSFILCMGDVALPSWLTFAGMRCMHTSLIIPLLLKVYNGIVMLKAPRFCLVQISIILMWTYHRLVQTYPFHLQRKTRIPFRSDQIFPTDGANCKDHFWLGP